MIKSIPRTYNTLTNNMKNKNQYYLRLVELRADNVL